LGIVGIVDIRGLLSRMRILAFYGPLLLNHSIRRI
jgi:hypothetical protein